MRNSMILLLAALLILAWFGSEVYIAQEICVTSCIYLTGQPGWVQAIAVAILPALLLLAAFRVRKTEAIRKPPSPAAGASQQ